jgi:hypothetical protein
MAGKMKMLSDYLDKINSVMQKLNNTKDFGINFLDSVREMSTSGNFSSTPNHNLPRIFNSSITPGK